MKEDLQQVMDKFPTEVRLSYARGEVDEDGPVCEHTGERPLQKIVVILSFSEQGFGFGEVCIEQTPEGVFVDTERMSLERVKKYVNMLLDSAILDTDEDPVRHALYDRATGRRCAKCPE